MISILEQVRQEAAEVAYWDGYKAAARENQIHLFVLAAAILLLILIF